MPPVTDPSGQISIDARIAVRGLQWKFPCIAATTANITIATALNSGDTIDGVTLADGDHVLVKDQSTASQNGIYIVGATPIRSWDLDQDATSAVPIDEVRGAAVYVIAGTANGGKVFFNTNTSAVVIGTNNMTWQAFSGAGISGITVEDEGTPLATLADTLDFVGAGVTATGTGTEKTITIPGGITVQDESTPLTTQAQTLDFQGSGVTATGSGTTKTITIPGGGVANVDVDIFTSVGNATWTKPTCTVVQVICIGGGGGGGSGRKGTGGTVACGGGGGGGGGMTIRTFLASDLGSTEKLTVGGGGGGASAQTTNSTNGSPGTAGNPSFFGNSVDGVGTDAKAAAGGGLGGGSGTSTAGAPAANGIGNYGSQSAYSANPGDNISTMTDSGFFAGGGASIQSGAARPGSIHYSVGGGGGGGVRNSGTERPGGAGGVPSARLGVTGAVAGAVHASGNNGPANTGDTLAPGGFGGSGGGGSNTAATPGGTGGNGSLYGGGGGGGGGGTDSVGNSGAGGNGADGIVVVISW